MDCSLSIFTHKHILFIRPIQIDTIYKTLRHSKFGKYIIFDEKKITYTDQEITFKFDPDSNFQLVTGLETNTKDLNETNNFYDITEHIGSKNMPSSIYFF